jgi:hypothetical protein
MPRTATGLYYAAIAVCLWAAPAVGQGVGSAFAEAARVVAVRVDSAGEVRDAARLLRLQEQLIRTAEETYRAQVVPTLPGLDEALRDVERRTRRAWTGLAPVIMLVPDKGRGFVCDEQRGGCLGRYLGAELSVRGAEGRVTAMSSIILIAESARRRPDVLIHELTHALLMQHGMLTESSRHDRRFFSEEAFVVGVEW